MAAQAELVHIRHGQVVARGATVRVMAIHATDLALTQGMVVRQARLSPLGGVAFLIAWALLAFELLRRG